MQEHFLQVPLDTSDRQKQGKIPPLEESNRHSLFKERNCLDWFEWIRGLGLEKHLELREMQRLEELRQANQLKMAAIDQALREEQTKIATEHAKTAEALLELQRNNTKDSVRLNEETGRLSRFNLIIAVVAVVLALGAFAYPNGIDWTNRHLPLQPGTVVTQPTQVSPTVTPAALTVSR